MASQRDIELASLLYRNGILTQEEIQSALGHQGRLLSEGTIKSFVEILVERELLPEESALSFSDEPLEKIQPLKDYRLDEEIGDGASARVYRGEYLPRELPVAVKVLHAEQALQEKPLKRFAREARLLCKLEHKNVVKGYECRKSNGFWFCSMEHVNGGTILEKIDKRGALRAPDALHVTRQIASALAYLYSQNIVHRDIKPGNVMADDAWNIKLIDLGLCRIIGKPEEASGVTVGTVGYISPEQARGHDLDVRSDIYSLGVSLYHMVAGEVPFAGDNDLEVMSKQIMQSLKSDQLKKLNIPPFVHYTIEKMMAKDREIRFQTPDEIVKELDAYLENIKYEPIPLARPVAEVPKAGKGAAPVKKTPKSVRSKPPVSKRRRRGRYR
ncbi:MAG: serine/threonine-protein kinase [Planctomycetota bacterium]